MNHQMIKLQKALETGFIDKNFISNHSLQPEFLVNDGQGKKVVTTIKEQLQQCDSFWFSVAFITSSGLACLKQELIELEKSNIKGKVLVSQYLNFTQPEALKQLLQFSNIDVRIAIESNFHAKGYLFSQGDIHNLIIGSSNFTANALTLNKEWNLKVSSSKNGELSSRAIDEFTMEFERSTIVTEEFIDSYEIIYKQQKALSKQLQASCKIQIDDDIHPNVMQEEALINLSLLRDKGASKAILISATGTGKTYLSAFDVLNVDPSRMLFVVHRANVAKAAMRTYQTVFKAQKTVGLYSGNNTELDKDFIFATIQTISRDDHLTKFDKDAFDYIVIDETHRASAASYKKILKYFNPKFLLGMTATPERTDGDDVFQIFDHNIAYEIRLKKALEMDILAPFHYYGITEVILNGNTIDDKSALNVLVQEERVKHILERIKQYGCDNGNVRGLVFCSEVKECEALASAFTNNGHKSIALTGEHTEAQRDVAIERLESTNLETKIDYIFSVGIFNEGIDIPSVNQIVMLRPTESAIIFVQQLGRGLRKSDNKDYLTVIDFIGNYKNNFLVPIALYGDESYNKDTLRKLMSNSDASIPGASTINFDNIAKEKIYKAIDSSNLQTKRDLVKDYNLLKFKLGYAPLMMDFINHGSRDPFSYVNYSKSLFNFSEQFEPKLVGSLNEKESKLLQVLSSEVNNGKRVGESFILKQLLSKSILDIDELKIMMQAEYDSIITESTISSFSHNLNLNFVTGNENKKLKKLSEIYGFKVVQIINNEFHWHPEFLSLLKNDIFKRYLEDSVDYSISQYNKFFVKDDFIDGFQLYKKYSRKDVFRILNWEENPVAQNVGGYIVSSDKSNCPIFVNYHKEDGISETTKYEDHFINKSVFSWMSKSKRKLSSPDVKAIRDYKNGLRLPLFIKKSNDEGTEFYYMGDITPQDDSFEQTSMESKAGDVSVVKVMFDMNRTVSSGMYNYLLSK
ncbi:DUF3427 domain-containing protein [Vibrio sp. F74]|uniref:DUF3427 domain-containing protein n=1 Tax=Vibrio sp. F74 TaxID=700020 RepID=UPI0035F592F8